MDNSRTCDVCNVNVHRASFAKHLRSKKHSENVIQNEMIIPEWFFKEEKTPIRKKIQKVYNPKTLKQLAREKIKLDDKELAKIIIIPYYFIDENLKTGFKINLESHNFNHANYRDRIFETLVYFSYVYLKSFVNITFVSL